MAESIPFSSSAPPRLPPRDCDVHQGAILFLPPKSVTDSKHGTPNHVRTLRAAGSMISGTGHGARDRFEVLTSNTSASAGAFLHPILVLSRPDDINIEFITLRSYNSTRLEHKWPLFEQSTSKQRAIVEHHLSISPAEHPLRSTSGNDTYRTLFLSDDLQMSLKSHVSVLPVHTMEWRLAERYFRKDELKDMVSHWQLDGPSFASVLALAHDKAQYTPGPQHPRKVRI